MSLWIWGILMMPFRVLPLAGSLSDTLLQDAQVLFLSELTRYTRVEVLHDNGGGCLQDTCLLEMAKRQEAAIVALRLLRLRERVILFSRTAYPDLDTLRVDRISLDGVEDLDPALTRLARSLATRVPYDETAEIGTLTRKETYEMLRRKWTLGMIGLGVYRALALRNLEAYHNGTLKQRMPTWSIFEFVYISEGDEWDLRVSYTLMHFATQFALLIHRFPNARNNSYFVGGGVGYTWYAYEDTAYADPYSTWESTTVRHGGNGITLFGNGGIALMRTYNAHAYLQLRTFLVLNRLWDAGIALGVMASFSS